MKDNFSTGSSNYAKFRPDYPIEVFDFILGHVMLHQKAWDCGTGNGQVAVKLAEFFDRVEATDISRPQIENAVKKDNIHYTIQPAESTNFPSSEFDLITCAQAVHWFNFTKFYKEVERCLRPDGFIVILGYSLLSTNKETDLILKEFYNDIVGPFWDEERRYLDDEYKTIPFPFQEIEVPQFKQTYNWSIEHLLGYLRTWSAVKHYKAKNGHNPVSKVENKLHNSFGKSNIVEFPILVRMGKIR